MTPIKLKNVTLGIGRPKIGVSLTGHTPAAVIAQAGQVVSSAADLVEWRLDFMRDPTDIETLTALLARLHTVLGDLPIIVTLRSRGQGGQVTLLPEQLERLYNALLLTTQVDALDLEFALPTDLRHRLATAAHAHQAKVIMSHHDFQQTPTLAKMLALYDQMAQVAETDIIKLAVMPQADEDVLALMQATLQASATSPCPLIAMSMGDRGAISRIAGSTMHSCVTFGALDRASAPGQLNVDELKRLLMAIQ